MRPLPCLGILLIACLTACVSDPPLKSADAVGSDQDSHACIRSAGYAWCSSTRQCERPWELARQHAFENNPNALLLSFHNLADDLREVIDETHWQAGAYP